jgi:hypothetical protein
VTGKCSCPQVINILHSWVQLTELVFVFRLSSIILNPCRVHPVAYIFNTDIQYVQRIYTYNPQSQPTIFSLFSLILSLHVSVPTDQLQENHINIFVFMRRITILHCGDSSHEYKDLNMVHLKMVRRDRNM